MYNYTDHLGNNRLSYGLDQNNVLKIIEENNYYPFGMKHEGYNSSLTAGTYKYKYNGKELQDELGLNLYDYGARNYDPALGKWMNIDPLAERYYGINPYAYVFNNPIELFDPDGMRVKYAREEGQSRKEFREAKREFKENNRQLMKDSKTHKNNFNQLKDSKNLHTISFNRGKGSSVDGVGKTDRSNGNGTTFKVDLDQKGNENEFVIGHETAHAVDIDNGVDSPVDLPNISFKDDAKDNVNKLMDVRNQNSEINETNASHVENIIRGEVSNSRGVKIPLRETYNLEIETRSPFSGKPTVKTKVINVKRDGYDYYKPN